MDSFDKTIEDIKNLKIQGAENVAKEATKALRDFSGKIKTDDKNVMIKEIIKAANKLSAARQTEPALRNSLRSMTAKLDAPELQSAADVKKKMQERADFVLKHFSASGKRITEFGSRKIRNGSIIFTHCHSSTVVNILISAKQRGINFEVHNTETRPRFQGRKTAAELSAAGIKVVHYVDSGAAYALKKADLMLIGADAITSEGFVANKVGSHLFAEIATDENIPVYSCTNSWKFDPMTSKGHITEIEERPAAEVWPDAPKKIIVRNPAFELIDPKHMTGIISELGVYRPEVFVQEVERKYKWMFE